MGGPLGYGAFFNPYLGGGGGGGEGMFESLAANVLRSLQFSYLLMKGFSSTSRALKDAGNSSERAFRSSSGTTVGSSRYSLRAGRGTTRKRNFNPRALGNECPGKNGAITGSAECKGAGTAGSKTRNNVERSPEKNSGGGPTQNGNCNPTYGGESPDCMRSSSSSSSSIGSSELSAGLDLGFGRHPAESAVVSKFSSGLTNRTLSITGLAVADGVSLKGLKPVGKGFAKGVKMASGVVKGVKTATGVLQRFSTPAESVVMGFGAANGVIMGYEAAKFIVSSAKISKDFVSMWKLTKMYRDKAAANAAKNSLEGKTIRERLAKGLKASDGALTLVKLTREFSGGVTTSFPSGLSNWDLITKGYEVSSGVLKVSEVALGWKGGMVSLFGKGFLSVKGAVSGIGVVVKTVVLTKEISLVILKGIGLWKGGKQALKVIQEKKSSGDFPFFKSKKKAADGQERFGTLTIALPKARAGAKAVVFPISCGRPPGTFIGEDPPVFSLMVSLASLLCADVELSEVGISKDCFDNTGLKVTQPYTLLYLALPSEC